MAVRVRDLEVALVLAREARSAAGQPSLRADQLRQLFGADELDEHERARIQAALEMAGVEPQPSLLSADAEGPVRFAAAKGAAPTPVFRRAAIGTGGRTGAGGAERGEFPTVAEFARSTLDRARGGRQASDSDDQLGAVADDPGPPRHPPAPAVPPAVGYPRSAPVGDAGQTNGVAVNGEATAGGLTDARPAPRGAAPAVPRQGGHEGSLEPPDAQPAAAERMSGQEAERGETDAPGAGSASPSSVGDEMHDWGPEPGTRVAASELAGAPTDEETRAAPEPERGEVVDGRRAAAPDHQQIEDGELAAPVAEQQPPAAGLAPGPGAQAAQAPPQATARPDGFQPALADLAPGRPTTAEIGVGLLAAAAVPVVATSVAGWRFGLPFIALSVIASGILLGRSTVPGEPRRGLIRTLRSSPPSRLALKLTAALTAIGIGASVALAGVRTTTGGTSSGEAGAALGDLAATSTAATRELARAARVRRRARSKVRRSPPVKETRTVAPAPVPKKTAATKPAPAPAPGAPVRTAPVAPAPVVPSTPPPSAGTEGLYKAP